MLTKGSRNSTKRVRLYHPIEEGPVVPDPGVVLKYPEPGSATMTNLLRDIELLDPPAARVARDLVGLIGGTPLLRLGAVARHLAPGVEVYAKAEWANPGGSVKDRAALRMILDGIRTGRLTRDRTLLDATSGNTGIGYAMIGAALGYRVHLCLPANAGAERKAALRAYGATLTLTSPLEGTDGAIREARRLVADEPERWFYPDQYSNPANWRAHYDTTGLEIWRQTEGRVTHFVAGLGTSGTFTGVSRRLRSLHSKVRLITVQPDSPFHGLDGLKHMASAIVPGIYDPDLADRNLDVDTEAAYEMTRRLAREDGVLVGPSGGAAIRAALDVAAELSSGVVVTILPDSGARYLDDRFWEDHA
jgi:cysteine synthase B